MKIPERKHIRKIILQVRPKAFDILPKIFECKCYLMTQTTDYCEAKPHFDCARNENFGVVIIATVVVVFDKNGNFRMIPLNVRVLS